MSIFLQDIFKHWLDKPAVLGFHIGNIDLLIEDDNNTDSIAPDFESTVSFLNELHDLTIAKSAEDGLDRYPYCIYSCINIM